MYWHKPIKTNGQSLFVRKQAEGNIWVKKSCVTGILLGSHETDLHCTMNIAPRYYTALHCTALHHTAPHCTALHCKNCTMVYWTLYSVQCTVYSVHKSSLCIGDCYTQSSGLEWSSLWNSFQLWWRAKCWLYGQGEMGGVYFITIDLLPT